MGASGIILKTGSPPVARLDGGLSPIEESDRLSDEEIKGIQFYISDRVLVQTESPTERSPITGGNVILVARETPGVVTDVGPEWIRVSFRKGSKV